MTKTKIDEGLEHENNEVGIFQQKDTHQRSVSIFQIARCPNCNSCLKEVAVFREFKGEEFDYEGLVCPNGCNLDDGI